MFSGKTVFTPKSSDRIKRRRSQVERAVHRIYGEPQHVFRSRITNRLYKSCYWAMRFVQFRLFHKDEEIDEEDAGEKLEINVKPPSLEELADSTNFDRKWIKYMYSRFKNECPTGKMNETEFRSILTGLISNDKTRSQYLSRLFNAFSHDDSTLTFERLIQCLSSLNPATAETNATWTVRLITGGKTNSFTYSDFLFYTESVFSLYGITFNDGEENKETARIRASTIFNQLDEDQDGIVSTNDLTKFFREVTFESQTSNHMGYTSQQ